MNRRKALLYALAATCNGTLPTRAADYKGAPRRSNLPDSVWEGLDTRFEGKLPSETADKLEADVEWVLKNTKAPGVTAAVGLPGKGVWSVSRGKLTTQPDTPVATDSVFHWASVGKAYTAALVLQLVDEQKLSLGDRLSTWFPDIPKARDISLEHLLSHTSGLYSFQADAGFRERKGYASPEELLEIALKHPVDFHPGANWAYSNTGYVLLGRILEAIEKRPLHEIQRRRLLEPLGLKRTVALAPRARPANMAQGHTPEGSDHFEPSLPFAAGNIAAPAEDVLRFWAALLDGKVYSKALLRKAFERPYAMFGQPQFYGLGVMVYEIPSPSGKTPALWVGHSGGTPGLKSIVAYDTGRRVFVAVAVNGPAPAEAIAMKFLRSISN